MEHERAGGEILRSAEHEVHLTQFLIPLTVNDTVKVPGCTSGKMKSPLPLVCWNHGDVGLLIDQS